MAQEGNESVSPQENSVSYKVGDQTIQVRLKEVNNLFSDIEKYNKQFSMGSMMFRMLMSHVEPNIKDEGESQTTKLSDEEGNQQTDAFFLISTHKSLLNNIGLSLEPVSGGVTMMAEGEAASQGEMMINVSDNNRFTSFLGALKPSQTENNALKANLEKVPPILCRQIMTSYNLFAPKQEAVELFKGMEKIISEYKRLGMTESVSELEEYFNHGKQGDLREYVAIKQRSLLAPPGKFFGPADWQGDTSNEGLEFRWNEALAILSKAKENPKAVDLSTKLYGHLKICADLAIQHQATVTYLTPEEIQRRITILEAAKQKLDMIARARP